MLPVFPLSGSISSQTLILLTTGRSLNHQVPFCCLCQIIFWELIGPWWTNTICVQAMGWIAMAHKLTQLNLWHLLFDQIYMHEHQCMAWCVARLSSSFNLQVKVYSGENLEDKRILTVFEIQCTICKQAHNVCVCLDESLVWLVQKFEWKNVCKVRQESSVTDLSCWKWGS